MSYSTIDQAMKTILNTGRHAFLSKCDITAAFKLLPISPSLVPCYGCSWNNQFYFFVRLPFGSRSSPRIFDCLSQALEWILIHNYGISYCQHLLDDFLVVDVDEEAGLRSMAIITMVFRQLGVPLSSSKTIGPVTSLVYLGIVLGTSSFECRISSDKITRMHTAITAFVNKKRCTKRELLQLLGHFSFATRVIIPGRSFMSYLLRLSSTVVQLNHHVRLSREARIDLAMWSDFLHHWNGQCLFLEHLPVSNRDLCLYTDAAGSTGYGGIFCSQWFANSWTSEFLPLIHKAQGSTLLELVPIVSAAVLWGPQWSRQRIIFCCDNEALVFILNKRRSSDSTIMLLIRRLTLLSLQHHVHIMATHIPGSVNNIADALSRHQWSRFRSLAPKADLHPCIPPSVNALIHPTFESS